MREGTREAALGERCGREVLARGMGERYWREVWARGIGERYWRELWARGAGERCGLPRPEQRWWLGRSRWAR